MIDTHQLKKRDLYLNKIIAFQDTEPVKVVTGIRRCGKSSLLKLMTLHLKEHGIGIAEGIYSTVIMRDILERENHKGQKRITDPVLLKKLRRGYDVSIGKIDNSEVDFIATNTNDKMYAQVTEAMTSEDVRKRELAPLQKISDNYEKIVLSLNPGMDSSYDGIKSINLIDWLISV